MPLGIPAVYSDEPPWYPQADGSCAHDPEADAGPGLRLDCAAGFGAATPVTGAFGFALAGAVVTTLTEG